MPPSADAIFATLKTNRLPSLPHVLVEMLDACHGQQASFQELSQIISRDAVIASKVLSMANSSYYSRGRSILSLEQALFILGTDAIKTIVITASIQQFFSSFDRAQKEYLQAFWYQSLSCALLAKSLAILTSYPNADEAYLTGLLHNIGELVLETNYGQQHAAIRAKVAEAGDRCARESEHFGVSHAEVGAWLFREWQLSAFGADALAYHHAELSDVCDAQHLVKIIYLSALMSEQANMVQATAHVAAQKLFDINASLVNEIAEKIHHEVKDVAQSLGLQFDSKAPDNDQATQVQLARHIRDLGLVQTATQNITSANTPQELNRAFSSTLELLFGYRRSLVFWLQQDADELTLLGSENTETTLKISLSNSRSLIATAAKERTFLTTTNSTASAQPSLPVIDQQIMRMLGSEHFSCIPIFSATRLYCVLAFTTNSQGINPPQLHLLQLFASEVARNCESTLERLSRQEQHLTVDQLMQRVHEVVHEANNPLNIVSNYLGSLADKLAADNESHEEIEVLREEIERTAQILFRLKDLEHGTFDDGEASINDEITALCKLYRTSYFASNKINCTLQLDSKATYCTVTRNVFRQILTNLLKNAVEAMPNGGDLSIKTAECVDANGQHLLEICVKDSGAGIPAHILKNLFSPVASSKGDGHSGLGLSITKNLVTDARGTISCRSNDKGTEFQILFPTKN